MASSTRKTVAQKAEENKYAVTAWGQLTLEDLVVPSGQLCQVRPAGVQTLMAAGVIENVDTLTTLVDEKHIKRVKPNVKSGNPAVKNAAEDVEIDTESIMKNPEQLQKMFSLVDKVVLHMVVQPTILPAVDENGKPIPYSERQEGVGYLDMVDMMDKMFIFQYAVGGSPDLESFRERFQSGMGGVADGEGVHLPA